MAREQHSPAFWPYRVARALQPRRDALRWLALHPEQQSSHTIYQFAPMHDRAAQRRFSEEAQALASVSHPHLLPLQRWSFLPSAEPWVVTTYPGNHDGIVTLPDLLVGKGGQLSPSEAQRAAEQLLAASAHAHATGLAHGTIATNDVLVERLGRVLVELYALGRHAEALGRPRAEVIGDEVRSIVELTYRVLTGVGPEEPRIPAAKLVKRLPKALEIWLDAGLDPAAGFATAEEALGALPDGHASTPRSPVRSVLGRLREWVS